MAEPPIDLPGTKGKPWQARLPASAIIIVLRFWGVFQLACIGGRRFELDSIYNFSRSLSCSLNARFGIVQGLVTDSSFFGKDGLAEACYDPKNQFAVRQDREINP
ncbi:hypothetical protein DFH29DRAFT_872158 [Suillus ampliporus]|nr:hypothetical protein DFH29DRAFT_872158 [Suillus ampliporus]